MPGADSKTPVRDTDADWRELGQTEPYWGVISHPDFRSENLTPERIEQFYQSGPYHIGPIAEALTALSGRAPSGRALDFGCGVGRLAEAMLAYAQEVTGVDISPGMLELARARGSRVAYVDQIPEGPFDWINSFIVFQHIPPERGMVLLHSLLTLLAPGGYVSLHFTTGREAHLGPPPATLRPSRTPVGRAYRKLRPPRELPLGHMLMHDYDLGPVIDALHGAGIGEMHLVPTNHGGHLGEMIFGRRAV